MIIGFSKHGRGDGVRAVDYLTEGAASVLPYLTAQARRGKERNPPPVVLRGDPALMRTLLDAVPFTRKYVSGVLSFEEQTIPSETEIKLMNRFEATAFAGLGKDRYAILWVRHADKGRHEMHFVTPAMDLATGKALNINPPRQSTRETFDTLRRLTNDEYHFSDPDDPSRAQAIRVPSYVAKGAATRDDLRARVTEYLEAKQNAGLLQSREDILCALKEAGLNVSRAGEDYITVVDSEGVRCRLKGDLFRRDFTAAPKEAYPARLSPEERAELQAKLSRLVAARAQFNERRYGKDTPARESLPRLPDKSPEPVEEKGYDGTRNPAHRLLGTIDQWLAHARSAVGGALARGRAWTDRIRERVAELGRASHRLGLAAQSVARAGRAIGERLDEAVRHIEARAVNAAIYAKYGARTAMTAQRHGREQEHAMELERTPDETAY